MTSLDTTIKRLLGIIGLEQTYIQFCIPIITLIFFDTSSRLFPTDTPMAIRSMWFGTCISIPYFVNLFFAPLLSSLSDEFGRRKFLLLEIFSAFFYTLLAALGILFGKLWIIILASIVRGTFSKTNITALAIIGDTPSKKQKMIYMSHIQLAISLGACLGPILSGFFAKQFYFATLNFSLPFFIAAFFALVNALLTYFFIAETWPAKSDATPIKQRLKNNLLAVKYLLTHADILKIAILLFGFQFTWSIYYQFMPPLLKTAYHFDPHQLGLFVGIIAFWLAIGSGPIFKLLNRKLPSLRILTLGAWLILGGVSMTLATYFHLLPDYFLWMSAIPIAIGDVIAYICLVTLFSNVVALPMQGKVMGISFLIIGLVWGGTGLLGGLLIAHSPIMPFILAPIGIIGSLFALNANFGRKMILNYST